MLSGIKIFKCDNCKTKFFAWEIEYSASSLSIPPKCKNCGSGHTFPWSIFSKRPGVYRKIWEKIENNN